MKPPAFSYHAPRTIDELLDLAAQHASSARILAGGQSLMPLLNARRVRLDHLIDLNGVPGLDRIEAGDGTLVLGALVRQADALDSAQVQVTAPLVAEALHHVANPTVRHRGTVCGSLAFAQPAAELPAVALGMGGHIVVRSAVGERRVEAEDFFLGPFATALLPGEVVSEVAFSRWRADAGHAFLEVSRLRLPVVGVAVLVELDGSVITRIAVALSGVAGTPIRARAVEAALTGVAPTDEAVADSAGAALPELDVLDTIHGTAAYRRRVAGVLVRRGVALAVQRARRAAA